MSGRTLTNVVNDQTVALNALIYGYAGHSLVTPHAALQQVWWTQERINEKVTPDFITSRLRPNERQWLNRPVGFGDLTDDTYMDWILEKARRLFLVLAEVGETDKIFTVVNNSWDDDDLPLQMEDIDQLSLSNKRDGQVNSRFYHTQFTFLLRELEEGIHIDYAPNEVLPLEYVQGFPPAVTLQHWSRVHRPKKPNEIYVRRKFPLGTAETPEAFEEEFIMDVESGRMVEHEHLAPVWASYTAKGQGYTLTNFVGQHTLRSFIDHRNPTQYQRLPKPERRYLMLGWLHCLADAIATLHQIGFCHSSIRPSNILIDENNNIAFSDIGSLRTFQKDKKPDPMEAYIYDAPEAHTDKSATQVEIPASPPPAANMRKPSVVSRSSSGSANSAGSQRQKLTKVPTNELHGFHFGFRKTKPEPKPRSRVHETEKADVFSLGCIFLEVMTFLMKKKPHDFVKHRSSKQKINIGGKTFRSDPSYHANLDKLDSWMKVIENLSFEQEDVAYRAVPYIMTLVRGMVSRAPDIRPSARDVRDRLLDILLQYTAIPNVHCGEHTHDIGVATSLTSSRPSSMSSTSTSSIPPTIASSDTDTIRDSIASSSRVSSILESYGDRSSIMSDSDLSDFDDTASISTIGAAQFPFAEATLTPPVSPRTAEPPTSPLPPTPASPRSSTTTEPYKIKPWNKPFLMLP